MQIEVESEALLDIVRAAIGGGFSPDRSPEQHEIFTSALQAVLQHSEDACTIAIAERANYFIDLFVAAVPVLDSARRIVVSDELTLQEATAALAELPRAVKLASTILGIANGEEIFPPEFQDFSTENRLRADNRIQDDPRILAKLGYEGKVPPPPPELVEQCSRTGGTLVLMFKTNSVDYQSKYNDAVGPENWHLRMYLNDEIPTLETSDQEPIWVNVPNTVKEDTLRLSKPAALARIPGSSTRDPMETVLMLGYHTLLTEQQLPGFKDKWTFTNVKNIVVGSHSGGIRIDFHKRFDAEGDLGIGLASNADLSNLPSR